jgi:hypothetical protein
MQTETLVVLFSVALLQLSEASLLHEIKLLKSAGYGMQQEVEY